jgi:hypothetical protein
MPSEDSLIDEARQTLDELVAEGYSLRQVKFEPQKGCRVCSAENVGLTVIFIGQKVAETKTFLYCMAKVCLPCLAVGEAEEGLTVMMLSSVIQEDKP